jgi:hypothetical protein
MFSQAWNKYLPIIKILMKRTPTGDQTLDMNKTDFERAAGGRKAKFTFNVALHKGRIQNITSPPPVAKELATILQEDEMTRKLVREFDYEFSMNSSFQLLIKNSSPPAEPAPQTTEEETNPETVPE